MRDYLEMHKKRVQNLTILEKNLINSLENVPKGSLRINTNGGRVRWYHNIMGDNRSEVYITKDNIDFARQLAQKDYNKKALKLVQEELQVERKYLKDYPRMLIDELYKKLHLERQALVIPAIETDEQFVARWVEEEYYGNPYFNGVPELYTEKGERVRSKSEIIIANLLGKEGVPYKYEYPLALKDKSTSTGKMISRDIYPDFTVLNIKLRREIYWEHFGMMDEPEYLKKALDKIQLYENNGIFLGEQLIATFESRSNPINTNDILNKIHHYLL